MATARCGARKARASGSRGSRPGRSMAPAGEGSLAPMLRERRHATRSRGCWAHQAGLGDMVIAWSTGRRCGAAQRDRRKARGQARGACRPSGATSAVRWCDQAWPSVGADFGADIDVVPDMVWLRQRGQILRMVFQRTTAGLLAEASQSLVPEVVIAANQADCRLCAPISVVPDHSRGVRKQPFHFRCPISDCRVDCRQRFFARKCVPLWHQADRLFAFA